MKYKKLEESKYIENKGDILACKYYHLLFPDGNEAIGSPGIKEINNKEWEIFWVSKETENAYYGSPAEGLGLVNCMILKTDTRAFLPEEIVELEKHTYALTGVLTEEVKHVYPVKINPIVEKWNIDKKRNLERKLKIKDEYLNLIVGIGFDYDGYNDADNLKGVIDELVKYAKKALNNDDSSIIYSGTNKKYNILNEELEGKNDN